MKDNDVKPGDKIRVTAKCLGDYFGKVFTVTGLAHALGDVTVHFDVCPEAKTAEARRGTYVFPNEYERA